MQAEIGRGVRLSGKLLPTGLREKQVKIIFGWIAEGIARESSVFEMWFAVAAVVAFSSSAQRYFIALALAAVALLAVRYAAIPEYSGTLAFIAVIALVLWSAIGCGLRAVFARYMLQPK